MFVVACTRQQSQNTIAKQEQPSQSLTPIPNQISPLNTKIEWEFIEKRFPLQTGSRGEKFYRLGGGFVTSPPKADAGGELISVFIPQEHRLNAQYASTAAVIITCGAKNKNSYRETRNVEGIGQTFIYRMTNGNELVVSPDSLDLSTVSIAQLPAGIKSY